MNRFFAFVLCLVMLFFPSVSASALDTKKDSTSDDQCVTEVFLEYADSLGKVSYKEIKEYLDSLNYTYKTQIGKDTLATFNIDCELGSMYLCFYPLGFNDSDFGKPEKEMLCCIEYSRDNKWISISDDMHINGGKMKTGDKSRNPVNQEVFTIEELVDYYNNTIGGNVSLEAGISVSTDAERENKVKTTINNRIKEYTNTTIQEVEVNSNAGTSDPDDFIVLIYLRWGTKNGINMTKTMLEMYSDDMAATLADKYEDASKIVLFWEVPYLLDKGTCAKYSFDAKNGKAYSDEKTGPLYTSVY